MAAGSGEASTVALRTYGGGKLPIVKQVQVKLARSGHQVKAIVQVQRGAPAKLLIGFPSWDLFVCTEVDEGDVDLLKDPG